MLTHTPCFGFRFLCCNQAAAVSGRHKLRPKSGLQLAEQKKIDLKDYASGSRVPCVPFLVFRRRIMPEGKGSLLPRFSVLALNSKRDAVAKRGFKINATKKKSVAYLVGATVAFFSFCFSFSS
jgi:hypothetical protein